MHLKTLSLRGFKSFARPVSVGLRPGVTVVVGPNGSGKSNLVDAVAWALGAQAPSAVRSSRMDDVIFAGTASRPPLGRAEVSLTIDNSDGRLAVGFPEVRIARTLFRSGESSYALNGAPCRLLDISEMLSDRGVGRHQHVIVSQNQIDSVLNARPGDRRAVLEEAAGIGKFRRRRERAERRLAGTDGDLARLGDLRRELLRQLRPLARQAEAARRHADLVAELKALRVYLAGREIAGLRERLRGHSGAAEARAAAAAGQRAELEQLREAAAACEQKLIRRGGNGGTETLARWGALRERARGLSALAAERRRGLEQRRAASADEGLTAALAEEAARIRRALAALGEDAAEMSETRLLLACEQARLEADRAAFEASAPLPATAAPAASLSASLSAAASAAAAEARGERAAVRRNVAADEAERKRLQVRLAAADKRSQAAEAEANRGRRELDLCRSEAASVGRASAEAAPGRRKAETEMLAARQALAAAESERRRWTAKRDGLSSAIAAGKAPAQALGDIGGLVGALTDLVSVDAGAEAAFAAAVGASADAVVVRSPVVAAQVLDRLEAGDARAAVIALEGLSARRRPEIPPSLTPLRRRVTAAAPDLDLLLDCLLSAAVIADGDWRAAAKVAAEHPDLVVVTTAGDRLSRRGWRLGVNSAAGAAAAWREAADRASAATEASALAAAGHDRARSLLERRSARAADLGDRLAAAEHARALAAEGLSRAEAELNRSRAAAGTLRDGAAATTLRLEQARARLARLDALLPRLTAAEAEEREHRRRRAEARADFDRRAVSLSSRRAQASAAEAGLSQRRRMLQTRLAEIDAHLARHRAAQAAATARLAKLEREDAVLAALSRQIAVRAESISAGLAAGRESNRRWTEQARALAARLDRLRRRSARCESRLDELRRAGAEADVEQAELRTKLQAAVELLREHHGIAPAEAVEAFHSRRPAPAGDAEDAGDADSAEDLGDAEDGGDGGDLSERAKQLASELKIMGPVNPLALEEHEEISGRHQRLQEQLADIRAARRGLYRLIRSVNREIEAQFAAVFADVAANFEVLFEALFPGGEGRLTLSDPDDLLATGIDVSARPSGKKVRRLSLLSGGERTLAALALLFAVFRSRPSPFYVLDEVEAALDDVNLRRFLVLVDEFRADAQLVIVTHQRRTMEAADFLYGVTMKPGGSSMVVCERVSHAA